MNDKCTDNKIGLLIHGYELGLLDELSMEKFDIHLLSCDFCLNEIRKYEAISEALCSSRDIINQLEPENAQGQNKSEPQKVSTTKYLRVAAVVLLISIPLFSYFLFRADDIRSTEVIQLFPDRSESNTIVIAKESNLELHFVYEESLAEKIYSITVIDEKGETIFSDGRFSDFNEKDLGKVLLSAELLSQGRYTLRITDQTADSLTNTREYRFNLYLK